MELSNVYIALTHLQSAFVCAFHLDLTGTFARQEMAPFAWKPIEFELQTDPTNFLSEKHWFDASQIAADHGFSHLLQTLPPEKLLRIKDIPPPTGYESKV